MLFRYCKLPDIDPRDFALAVSYILNQQPDEVIDVVTDPATGLPGTLKWPLTLADVSEACKGVRKWIDAGVDVKAAGGWEAIRSGGVELAIKLAFAQRHAETDRYPRPATAPTPSAPTHTIPAGPTWSNVFQTVKEKGHCSIERKLAGGRISALEDGVVTITIPRVAAENLEKITKILKMWLPHYFPAVRTVNVIEMAP